MAGGLGMGKVNLVSDLIKEFGVISIDAETGVRDEQDNLDVENAKGYVKESLEAFGVRKI